MRAAIQILILLSFMTFTNSAVDAQIYGNWLDIRAEENPHDFYQPSCVYPGAGVPDQSFNCYFFVRPREDSFVATECKIILPDPAMSIGSIVYHPNIYFADGDWLTRMVLNFDQCMTEPTILGATIEVQISPPGLQPGCMLIDMWFADGTDFFGIRTCEPGNPEVDAQHASDIYVNCDPCPVATEALSWGAIKGLYKY